LAQSHTPRNSSVQMRTLAQAAAAAASGGGGGGGGSSTTPMRTMHAAMRPPAVDITGEETDSELSPQTANGEFGNPESPGPPPAAAAVAAASRHQRQPSAGDGSGVGAGASSRQLPAASSTSKRPALSPSQRRCDRLTEPFARSSTSTPLHRFLAGTARQPHLLHISACSAREGSTSTVFRTWTGCHLCRAGPAVVRFACARSLALSV
jgi:hypothetical protein